MDKGLKLFILGFFVGLIVALVPLPGEVVGIDDSNKIMKQVFSGGITVWKVLYFSVLIVILPFLVIEPLRKRLTMKQFLPLTFIVGNSYAGIIVIVVVTVSTLF